MVSIQESLAAILELTFEYWPYMGLVASRLGRKPIQPLDFLECRDGWIFICCVEEHQWQEFVRMIGSPEWAELELFADRLSRGANWDALKIFLQEWASEQTRRSRSTTPRRSAAFPFAPVSTMGDLLASDHLKARGFFAVLDRPEWTPSRCPAHRTSCRRHRGRSAARRRASASTPTRCCAKRDCRCRTAELRVDA